MGSYDIYIHIVEAAGLLGMGWKIVRSLTRILDALENFPPHRHVEMNGKSAIIYPKEFSPGTIEKKATS